MMGLGYLGSSSSNLSPLAPPFTVDRSNHYKHALNSNPVSHFNDPSYAFSQSTGDSSRTTNEYGYIVSDPPMTHNWGSVRWSAVNPSPKRVDDSLFYNISEAQPFNPSFGPTPSVKVDDAPILSFSDEKPVETMGNDDCFFLKEACLNQGAYSTETLSKGKYDPSMLYYAGIIRRSNTERSPSDGTSSFANNQRFDSSKFSIEESHFRAFPVFSESHPLPIQSPENLGNSQKITTPYEKKYYRMFEDRLSKPTKKTSSIVIKSPAAAVSGLSASSKSLEIGNAADAAHSSIEDTKLSSASDQLIFEFKAKPNVLQVPDINIPDAASSFDHHNPAEDSPCWKGTPVLPFGSSQTQPSTKKLQKGINLQEADNHEKTSLSPIPFHNNTNEVVDSSKVRDSGDNAIKPNKLQTLNMDLPNLEEAARLPAEMNGEAADKNLNASALVKALYNLSDLLLRACLNEALNKHDHETLNHVTRNLGACLSRQAQVDSASPNKLHLPHSYVSQESQVSNKTSGTLQDGGQHAQYQKMKFDSFGESVKNLREYASPRDSDPPKDDNMVQAIKKILDENLECEVEAPSETTLLYKNLWLEAEAELCSLSYRARFERLKRETQKETPHKSTARGDRKETLKSCNGSTFLKADDSKVLNAQHAGNIINVYGEQKTVKEGHVAGVKVTGSGVTVQHQVCKDDDEGDSGDPWVIPRLNTLEHRGESNTINLEERACGEKKENHIADQGKKTIAAAAVGSGSGSDWEHILKDEVSWRLN